MKRYLWLFLGIALIPTGAEAANHYVRDGGSGDGSDWTNACDDFAGSCAVSSLVRGDTYYVADGNYAGRNFNRAASSNQLITIKKATTADHGTETGWLSTYGDGQAIFTSAIEFSSDDWVLDGSTRDESNPPLSWFTSSAYGFKIANNGNSDQQQLTVGAIIDNLTVKYTWFEGRTGSFSGSERRYSVDLEFGSGPAQSSNFLFQRNLSTDSNQWYFLRRTNITTIEYCAMDRLTGNEFNHGDGINGYWTADNVTVRWNVMRDACTNGCTGIIPIANEFSESPAVDPNFKIYGNLVYDFGSTDGWVGFTNSASSEGNCTNCIVTNNTLINGGNALPGNWGVQMPNGSGNTHRNNIYFETTSQIPGFSLGSGATNTHNAFGDGSSSTGSSAQTNLATSQFVNFVGKNFQLASATSCGVDLGAPYNVDMLGNTRGADGCWDRGAFEFCTGGCGAAEPSRFNLNLNLRRASNALFDWFAAVFTVGSANAGSNDPSH